MLHTCGIFQSVLAGGVYTKWRCGVLCRWLAPSVIYEVSGERRICKL